MTSSKNVENKFTSQYHNVSSTKTYLSSKENLSCNTCKKTS